MAGLQRPFEGHPPRLARAAPSLGLVAGDAIDAVSDGRDTIAIAETDSGTTGILFSVRSQSFGLAGTDVAAERAADTGTGNALGHSSDIFIYDGTSGMNVLAPAGMGWTLGSTDGDEQNCGL